MDTIKIERIGGIAGFGLPRSRIKSLGAIDFDRLSDADRKTVEDLLAQGGAKAAPAMRDGLTCRITRETDSGSTTVEVPETLVPAALTATIRDEIK